MSLIFIFLNESSYFENNPKILSIGYDLNINNFVVIFCIWFYISRLGNFIKEIKYKNEFVCINENKLIFSPNNGLAVIITDDELFKNVVTCWTLFVIEPGLSLR
jgi:hypothetical protein